ncbi:MAG: glutamate--tRNA ligase [Bdellovibrionales bacterium]|nr:glutamate--tRNA ligase [Bdellovibrionales bacterium]
MKEISVSNKNVRVRFAPSPTGWLHLGSARTALINYLFAKNQNGTFVLRVEDTDLERGDLAFLQQQINDLKWLGLSWDEGPDPDTQKDQGSYKPYLQSQRLPLYQKCVHQLIKMDKAYYCFLTDQEIDQMKKKALEEKTPFRVNSPYRNGDLQQAQERIKKGESAVVRFKVPEVKKNYVIEDIVRGKVTFPSDMVGDFVLLRSSGLPVYNFSCAVDDYFMKISHVFRSEEHLANTLRQMMIFEAFNWPLPVYGHLSLILGEDRKKLSKRHGAVSCNEYKKQGYLPGALLNFLALMGWNPKTEEEIFSLSELINSFSLKGLNPAPGVFDKKKLNWINSQHLKQVTAESLWEMLTPYFKQKGLIFPNSSSWKEKAVLALRSSFSSLEEAVEVFSVLSKNHFEVHETAKDILKWPSTIEVLNEWKIFLKSYASQEVSPEAFTKACKEIQKKLGVKGKFLFMPIRAAVLGCPQGLELKLIISLIKRDVLLKRICSLQKK